MKYPPQSKPWFIIGVGAIGSLWAHHLLHQGLGVHLLLRDNKRLAQWQQAGGLTIVRAGGSDHDATTESFIPSTACPASLTATLDRPIEQLIVSCKAQQSLSAFTSVASAVAHGATVILVQNGMGVAEPLQQQRPDLQLYCAITTSGAHVLAPFRVQQAGQGLTQLGRYPRESGSSVARSQQLIASLNSDLLPINACADIYRAQWHKLAVNCVINPLTALYQVRNGDLLGHAQAGNEAAALCGEISAVSQALNMSLTRSELEATVSAVCRQTAANISSMLQDVRAGRRTEIDCINGYLQRQARRHGIDCPLNDTVLARLRKLEAR